MSYMGAYVLWLEENGYAPTMDRVEQYHKENPNMIPKPREPQGSITQLPSFFTLGKEEDG